MYTTTIVQRTGRGKLNCNIASFSHYTWSVIVLNKYALRMYTLIMKTFIKTLRQWNIAKEPIGVIKLINKNIEQRWGKKEWGTDRTYRKQIS